MRDVKIELKKCLKNKKIEDKVVDKILQDLDKSIEKNTKPE